MNTAIIIFAVIGMLNCISLIGVFGWRIIKKNYNDNTIQSDIEKQTAEVEKND